MIFNKLISICLFITLLVCIVIMIDLPREIRFINSEFNYLFVGFLYMFLAILITIRILLIKSNFYRKPMLVLGMIVVVFPCAFILSVCLENFDRIRRMNGIDMYMQLAEESISNNIYLRKYKKANLNLVELHGFGNNSARYAKDSIWDNTYKRYIPTIKIIRSEQTINQYLKIIRSNR